MALNRLKKLARKATSATRLDDLAETLSSSVGTAQDYLAQHTPLDELEAMRRRTGVLAPDVVARNAIAAGRALVERDPGRLGDIDLPVVGRVRDVGRAVRDRDAGALADVPVLGPGLSGANIRGIYRNIVDPTRELAMIATEDPGSIAGADFTRLRDPERLLQEQGKAFRARPDDRRKFVTETVLDPANLIGGGAGTLAKQAGRIGLREVALPVVGGLAGGEIGRRVGGETGEQIGRIAGLVGGGLSGNRVERLANAFAGTKLGPDAAGAVTKPSARETIRQMARGPRAMPETVSLHAGVPLKPWMATSLIGGAFGASTADEDASLQETALRGTLGAVGGAAVGRVGAKGFRAANEGIRSVVLPSSLRDPNINTAIRIFDKAATSAAPTAGFQYRNRGAVAAKNLLDEVRAGRVTETPVQQQRVNALIAGAATPEAKAATDAARLSTAAILQNPQGFNLSGNARKAADHLRQLYDEQLAKETAAGVAPQTLRANYVNQVWDRDPGSAAVKRRPGAKQAFQQQHHIEDYLEGISKGYTPKTLAVEDLLAARVQAGETAIAQKRLMDTIKAHPEWLSKTNREGYRAMDGVLSRSFPTIDTAAMDQILTDLSSGATDIAGAKRALRSEMGAGRQMTFLRDDVADALESYFNPGTVAQSKGGQFIGNVAGVPRSLKLGFDLAMTGRLTATAIIQGTAADPLHPWRGVSAVGKAWWDARPGNMRKLQNSPEYLDSSRYLSRQGPDDLGEVLEKPAGKDPFTGLMGGVGELVLGGTGRKITEAGAHGLLAPERWQFGSFVPAMKHHTFMTLVDSLSKTRAYRNMPPEELKRLVGYSVDTLNSGFDATRAGIGKNQSFFERLTVISPNYLRGAVALATDVSKGGPEGMLARRFWGGMFTVGIGFPVLLTILLNPEMRSVEGVKQLLDPNGDKSIINPTSPYFMNVVLPEGGRVNIFGPIPPLARTVLAPPVEGVRAGLDAATREGFTLEAGKAGLGAALATMGVQYWERGTGWMEGRASVPLAVVRDLVKNENFRGRAIATAETEGEQWKQRGLFAASQGLLPSISGFVVDTERVNQPQWEVGGGDRRLQAGLQTLGFTSVPGPRDPQNVKDTVAPFLRSQGVDPGQDPVGAYRRASGDGSIGTRALAEFKSTEAGKSVTKYIYDERKARAEEQGRPVGKDAAAQFQTHRDDIAQWESDRLAENDRKLDEGSRNRDDWKKQRSRIKSEAFTSREQAAADWLGTRNLDEAQGKLDKVYGNKPGERKQDHAGMLVDTWYSIQPADESREAFTDFLDRRRAWKENLKATDPQGYEDWQKTLQSRMSPIEREYQAALEVYDQYNQISPYRNLDVKTARRVSELVNRADNSVRARLYRTRAQAIWADKTADGATKAMARRVASGRYANRERARFRQQNLILSKWFGGDMVSDELERVTA